MTNELWAWGHNQPVARLVEPPVYAVDDRPPLQQFPFFKVQPYSKPFAHYRVPKLPVMKFVPDGELPDPLDAELWFTSCYHGPAAPYPLPPTPEEILDSALRLDLENG